ncbi:LAQU0S01e14268g1_1 [Lachancea quebecensis]|uniref:LAQU0S01e14268g1_1 n=1 Tax=Lachancea quebecensis TaxID=1654605 RepID=A0A0P1KXK7_9SACH|nr:LAQU0S01e14268g1_1 [Lachancea quebecensis]
MSSPPKSNTKLLDELLENNAFQPNDSKHLQSETYVQRQDCLNAFLKGDCKGCLEKMLQTGLLRCEHFENSPELWKLYLSACSQVKFETLGISLSKAARSNFSEFDPSRAQRILAQEPLCEQMAGTLMYLTCCYKCARAENSIGMMKSLEVASRDYIRDCSEQIERSGDTREASQVLELVWFYMFYVQSEESQKRMSSLLYEQLCKFAPGVSRVLQTSSENKPSVTLESQLISRIEALAPKRSSMVQNCQHRKLKPSGPRALPSGRSSETTPVLAPVSTTVKPDKAAPLNTSKLKALVIRLQPFLSSKFVPVMVFALLLALKKAQKVTALPNKLARILVIILRRLGGIINIILSI